MTHSGFHGAIGKLNGVGTVKYNIGIQVCLFVVSASFSQNPNQLSDVEICQGFTSLFDGTATTFRNQFVNYIRMTGQQYQSGRGLDRGRDDPIHYQQRSDIRSKTKYRDFDLRMTYKNTGNEGVYYRFSTVGAWPYESGVEWPSITMPRPLKVLNPQPEQPMTCGPLVLYL